KLRDDLGRQVDHGLPDSSDRIYNLRFKDINGAVSKISGGVIDLLVKSHDRTAIIKLQNAAGGGVIGSKPEHRHHVAGRPGMVGSDQCADIEIGEIVGMRQHERLVLKPL